MRIGVGVLVVFGAVLAGAPVAAVAEGAAGGLSLGATGEVLYDSNQLRSRAVGGHSDDFRYSPSAHASYSHSLGRGSVLVDGVIGRDFFEYNRFLNRSRFGGGGVLSQSVGSRCSAVVSGNYSSRQNGIRSSSFGDVIPPGQADLPPDDIGRLIDNRQIAVSYGINANCGAPGGRLSFGGGANRSSIDNGASTRRFANSNSAVYSLFAGLGVFRPGQLQINGSFSTISYPNRLIIPGFPVSPVGLNTGVKTYRAGLTYSRPIGTKLSGSIGASYLTSRPGGGQPPYSAPAYNFSLSYHPGTRLNFSLSGDRSVLSSTSAGALFRVVDQLAVSASYQVGEAISVHANAGLTANNYKLPFAIPGEPARRTDSSKHFGVGLNYAPRSLYDVGVSVSQTYRNSNVSLFDYNATRASISLSVHV